jgi:hypothetical protein
MVFSRLLLLLMLLTAAVGTALAQTATLRGVVQDASSQKTMPNATVRLGDFKTMTDEAGAFALTEIPFGTYELQVLGEEFISRPRTIVLDKADIDLGAMLVSPNPVANLSAEDIIPTVAEEDDRNGSGQSVSGILTASRDVFVSTTAFVFGPMRFRLRGYDPENTAVYMNGVPMNDIESGMPVWSLWGGLNDVMRSREINYGLQPLTFSYGALGGGTNIDARASKQRKQIRVGYALSNRAYRHRLMATYNTGMLKNGWAFSLSASRRWADEGYIPGTYYDSWAYFGSAEKRLGNHSIALTVIGTPTARGGNTPTFQEMYDIAGTNFYNPQWGYQNGKKRNARVSTLHQPLFILSHEWKINEKSNIMTSASYQFGKSGITALDWYAAADPRPDYYRNLPSYYAGIDQPAQAAELTQYYQDNPEALQINWHNMYDVNRNSYSTISDANGVAGETVTGNRARYILSERRMDVKKFYFNSVYQNNLTDKLSLFGGLTYQWESTHNFQIVDDLLGADYYVDIDRFAERDSADTNPNFAQNNLDRPNGILKVGDTYGYDYNSQVHVGRTWGQATLTTDRIDAFLATELSYTTFWRQGNVRNGKFPENSLGNSEIQSFFNYAFKGGATFKIDGRNFLFANGSYMTRAPYFRDSYIAPRVRDQVVPDLGSERIASVEGGYLLKAPKLQARAVGYITQFNNQFYNRSFFLDNALTTQGGDATGGFVNYIMKGINKRHIGVELAIDAKIAPIPGLSARAVAAIGQAFYTNRPTVSVFLDNAPQAVLRDREVYIKNYNVAAGPQQAFTAGLNYSGKQFYFLNVNFNYYRNNWIDINPDRRTQEALAYTNTPVYQQNFASPESDLGKAILNQQKTPDVFTMDFFGGKSFRIRGKDRKTYFIYINAGVSNLLNNRNVVAFAFEQLRFDYENKDVDKFPARISYNFGANYFINVTFKM